MNSTLPAMVAVPVTLIGSLTLVATFVLFFLGERARNRHSSAERDSLLPLAEETPARARAASGPRAS